MKSGTSKERVLDGGQPRSPVMSAGTGASVRRAWRCNADRNYCETNNSSCVLPIASRNVIEKQTLEGEFSYFHVVCFTDKLRNQTRGCQI